jgi:hypothetical protein
MGVSGGLQGGMTGGMNGGMMGGGRGRFGGMVGGMQGMQGFMNGGELCVLCKPCRRNARFGSVMTSGGCKSRKLSSLRCAMRCHAGGSSGMGVGGLQGMNGGMNGGMAGQGMQGFLNDNGSHASPPLLSSIVLFFARIKPWKFSLCTS